MKKWFMKVYLPAVGPLGRTELLRIDLEATETNAGKLIQAMRLLGVSADCIYFGELGAPAFMDAIPSRRAHDTDKP